MKYRLLTLSSLLALAGCSSPSGQIAPGPQGAQPSSFHVMALGDSGRILIKTANAASEARALTASHGRKIDSIPQLGVSVVEVPDQASAAIARIRNQHGVIYAEVDELVQASDWVPDDPMFAQQWGLDAIHSSAAWAIATSSALIKIAVLDTGISLAHQDLAAKLVSSTNFTSSPTSDDRYGHGTHVAGIAAAITNNHAGVAGVAVEAKLMNVKVLGDTGSGQYSWLAKGMIYAADNGAKVINMSLGGSNGSQTLKDAVSYAANKEVVIAVAAGNNGSTALSYPAAYEPCIAVAATDLSDRRASFSNYGDWVDVSAPGVNILSTLPRKSRIGTQTNQSDYGILSGTSMAAPFVAGEAAILWGMTAFNSSADAVRQRILSTTDPLAETGMGVGRLNLLKAVSP